MDILLAGGSSRLTDELIDKFRKEGHRVYLLTGSRNRNVHYRKVFEKYYFPYDSDLIMEIFESVMPDTVIFTGAYDTNFEWAKNAQKEAVRFQSGLVNMLIAFAGLKKGRFIYLSSEEVYSGNYDNNITEKEAVTPANTRAMVIAQGEQMCVSYDKNFGVDSVVLRIENMYNTPHNRSQVRDVCSSMCLEAVSSGSLTLRRNDHFAMLHQSDAVEFIYRITMADKHNSSIYNLSSSVEVTREQLADIINSNLDGSIHIEHGSGYREQRKILSNRAYNGEFGAKYFHTAEESIADTIEYMKKKPAEFLDERINRISLWERIKKGVSATAKTLIPFAENLVCFIPFFMLNNRVVGSNYFANLDFYLLYVLLFAIVYGQHQAVFSAVLATAGYCFRQMYDRSGFDVMIDYNTYVWIAQLFILGLVVGYMRNQIRMIREEGEQQVDYLSGLLVDIEDINDSNMRMKNVLETQIVNQNDSFGKLYEITSKLEQYSPQEVLFYAAEVVSNIVRSKDVAIYTVANGSYARLFSSTSPRARELGNSVNYTSLGPVYEALVNKNVYINRQMEERYPLMANAIYSEEEMQIIIMIWGIPWERMTLSQANMLKVVSYLIQNAVVRANRYLEALEYKRYVEGTKVLEAEAFEELVKVYQGAKMRGLTECTFLRISCDARGVSQSSVEIASKLRQSDVLGDLNDGYLYALLANTNESDAGLVMERFAESGYQSQIMEDLGV